MDWKYLVLCVLGPASFSGLIYLFTKDIAWAGGVWMALSLLFFLTPPPSNTP